MANDLKQAQARVEAALKLLDSETADLVIGTSTDELKALEQGAQSALAMVWMMAVQSCGIKVKDGESHPLQRVIAQATLMVVTMVHYAFALGMRRGQRGD
jgi:hypothetical protein